MRAVWLCVLLLQAWAAPIALAESDRLGSLEDLLDSDKVASGDSLQVGSQSLRGLHHKKSPPKKSPPKKSPPKKSPPKKSPPKKESRHDKGSSSHKKKSPPKKGKPGKPGKKGVNGQHGTTGVNGQDGIPGPTGLPGTPGTPGAAAYLGDLFILSNPTTANTTVYTGPILDGIPTLAAVVLATTDLQLNLNYDFNALNTNSTLLNQVILASRLAVAKALGLYEPDGVTLSLYLVQGVTVEPGSIKLKLRVYGRVIGLSLPRLIDLLRQLLGAVFTNASIVLTATPSPTGSPVILG